MLIEKLSTSEWIECLDREAIEKMSEHHSYDGFIHIEKPSGQVTHCERDSDTFTYVLTWTEYIRSASGQSAYPYQGRIPYCGTCLQPVIL